MVLMGSVDNGDNDNDKDTHSMSFVFMIFYDCGNNTHTWVPC